VAPTTPLPWINADCEDCTHLRFEDRQFGHSIAMSAADYEFAHHAAHCHADLLAALQQFVAMDDANEEITAARWCAAVVMARAAIASAT
jgi:hypothetical protein